MSNIQSDSPVTIFICPGSFHTFMSFTGTIGFIMGSSGIKELWTTIFAPHSVNKIL